MPKVLCRSYVEFVGRWGLLVGCLSIKRRLGGFLKVVALGVGVTMVFVHEREVGRFSRS